MSALLSEHQGVRTLVLDHVVSWDGLDLATGAFDVVASGFVQRGNDSIEGPVRSVRLTGNVLTMLSNLVEIASDTDRIEHVDAPGMLVEGVKIA
jgi:predicted Zn-dependent protease